MGVKSVAVSNLTAANTGQDGADLQKVIEENGRNVSFNAENKKS